MKSERHSPSPSHSIARRRIAWLTPDFPPDRGGVSDHSSAMVDVLRAAGHEVLVCASPQKLGFRRLHASLKAYAPDLVVVAYTPLGYGPRTGGIAPAFALWSIGLQRRYRCHAILLAHEASLPAAHLWRNRDFKLAALAAGQISQFSVLAASYGSVLFSNLGTREAWARHLPILRHRFHTFRICSNIPLNFSSDPARELAAAGLSVPAFSVLFFGTGHQSVLFDYVEAAFLAVLEVEPRAVLVIVGMSPEKLRQLCPSLADLGPRVLVLGYVAAPTASLWLQTATLVLAPLAEGVSARKGTVMAALQHGRAVVTTRGAHTLDDIAWDEICIVTPLDRETFAATAAKAFNDAELRTIIGLAARTEYDAHASATVTALSILERSATDPTAR